MPNTHKHNIQEYVKYIIETGLEALENGEDLDKTLTAAYVKLILKQDDISVDIVASEAKHEIVKMYIKSLAEDEGWSPASPEAYPTRIGRSDVYIPSPKTFWRELAETTSNVARIEELASKGDLKGFVKELDKILKLYAFYDDRVPSEIALVFSNAKDAYNYLYRDSLVEYDTPYGCIYLDLHEVEREVLSGYPVWLSREIVKYVFDQKVAPDLGLHKISKKKYEDMNDNLMAPEI